VNGSGRQHRRRRYGLILAGVPHLPINASDESPATCIIARTDPHV
jgi:uncharacterized RmlC-like cupin family protein